MSTRLLRAVDLLRDADEVARLGGRGREDDVAVLGEILLVTRDTIAGLGGARGGARQGGGQEEERKGSERGRTHSAESKGICRTDTHTLREA